MITSYNTAFKQHPMQPRESCKPDPSALRSEEPLSDKTTFRSDYIKHPVDKPYSHPYEQYKRPVGEIDGVTSYNKDFTAKHAPPAQLIKHSGQRHIPTKFEGEPTYKVDYKKWPLERIPQKAPDCWVPPTQPFEGQSTFTSDYRKYHEPPRTSLRPNQATHMSDAPFDGNTGYRDDYIRHQIPLKHIKDKECYKAPNVKFDGMTTINRDFTKKEGLKTESCKSNSEAFQSGAPLDDLTTFKNDYRQWNGERPFVHQPDVYVKPEGEIDHNTTNRINYKQHPMQRVALVKPGEGRVMNPGTFDGLTSYKNDFKKWGVNREMPKPREGWVPSNQPFEGCPTYKAHYITHSIAPPKSMRPTAAALNSGAPFDDATMYRTEFTKKEANICEAALLETGVSKYTFVEMDNRGHKQYKPMWEKTTPLRRVSSATIPKIPATMVA